MLQLRAAAAAGLGAVALFLALTAMTGGITANHGYGYDGADYVEMLNEGLAAGTPSTRLRPLVVAVATALDRFVFDDPVETFRALNLAFVAALAVILAGLCRHYGATPLATAVLLGNVFLTIAVAKMFAFYPTLVDLGAYVFVSAAVWAIVAGPRPVVVLTVVLAVFSREFAGALIPFGLVRDLRARTPLRVVLATYAPAVVAVVGVRWFAASVSVAGETVRPLSTSGLLASLFSNLSWWADPYYALFWVYFAFTVFGGVSLFALSTSAPWRRCLRDEPEWLAFILPVTAVTVVGYLDMWRYLAFVLPAMPVLWAWGLSAVRRERVALVFTAVTAATLLTQRPWQAMDLESYFRDWFPYYLVVEGPQAARDALWPLWTYRTGLAAACLLAVLVARLAAGAALREERPT